MPQFEATIRAPNPACRIECEALEGAEDGLCCRSHSPYSSYICNRRPDHPGTHVAVGMRPVGRVISRPGARPVAREYAWAVLERWDEED